MVISTNRCQQTKNNGTHLWVRHLRRSETKVRKAIRSKCQVFFVFFAKQMETSSVHGGEFWRICLNIYQAKNSENPSYKQSASQPGFRRGCLKGNPWWSYRPLKAQTYMESLVELANRIVHNRPHETLRTKKQVDLSWSIYMRPNYIA